jgi:hypothetical protein
MPRAPHPRPIRLAGACTSCGHRGSATITIGAGTHRGRADVPALDHHPYNRRITLAAINGGISDEAQAAQSAVEAATGPVPSAVAQAGTSTAEARAQTEAAVGNLVASSEAQPAADRNAVTQFWDRYYSSFNPMRGDLATKTALAPRAGIDRAPRDRSSL